MEFCKIDPWSSSFWRLSRWTKDLGERDAMRLEAIDSVVSLGRFLKASASTSEIKFPAKTIVCRRINPLNVLPRRKGRRL
jgi:hypothetical protein